MTIRNSGLVANYLALPQVANPASELRGRVRIAAGNVALLAGDSTDNDIVYLAPLPSHANLISCRIGSDALGGSCTFNVGLYKLDDSVVDEDCIATSVADGAAIAELRYEVLDLNTTGQKLYELGGLSTDPSEQLYVAVTFNATGGTAGDLAFIIEYAVD
jgi:hypothetical protein